MAKKEQSLQMFINEHAEIMAKIQKLEHALQNTDSPIMIKVLESELVEVQHTEEELYNSQTGIKKEYLDTCFIDYNRKYLEIMFYFQEKEDKEQAMQSNDVSQAIKDNYNQLKEVLKNDTLKSEEQLFMNFFKKEEELIDFANKNKIKYPENIQQVYDQVKEIITDLYNDWKNENKSENKLKP